MATVNKDFKIKSGLVVEGTTGTINGLDILTKKQADQDYIVGLIGGTATSENTPDTVVKRDANGDFAAHDITVSEISIGEIGRIYDDGDLIIENIDGMDVQINAEDIRLNAADDLRVLANDDIVLESTNGDIRLEGSNIYAGTNLQYVDSEKVATRGYVDDVASDVTDHINATEAHGATGAVVGTTNEQTLTNKTISYTDNTLTVQVANVSDLTATASELNTLDGITASTAELNLLDGVTATTTELNYVDGVTSGIQGQLDDKAPLASPALTGTPTAPTATAGTNTTQVATTAFVGTAVSNLVGSAPELLNTLQELAAAIDNDPETINNLQSLAAGKQDNLTAGDNISIDGSSVISVTGLDSADISDFSSAAVTANTGLWDTIGDAADAEQNAKDYADAKISDANGTATDKAWSAYKTATEIGIAQQAATDVANSLTTDDVAEGTVQYFTDARAKDSAVNLLTNATQNNIEITWSNPTGLVITAENGVADSTTADLAEDPAATSTSGTMYFTDSRALGAISGENIQPESIDITWVRREEATWTDVPTASKATCHSAGTNEGSMKYLVRVTASVGGTRHSHVTEVLATVDGSNGVAVVEYGTIYTSTEPLATVTVEWNASTSKYDLNVTTANNSSEVMVAATLMATLD
jgi:hypothetical protein